jgi:hypothetical protein
LIFPYVCPKQEADSYVQLNFLNFIINKNFLNDAQVQRKKRDPLMRPGAVGSKKRDVILRVIPDAMEYQSFIEQLAGSSILLVVLQYSL